MNFYDVLKVLIFLLCLGGLFSVFSSVSGVDAESGWDGCMSQGSAGGQVCYVTWDVGAFDTGVPLVVSVSESEFVNESESSDRHWLIRVFEKESFVFN